MAFGTGIKSIQKGSVTLAVGTSTTVTINAVGDKAVVYSNCKNGVSAYITGPAYDFNGSSFSIGISITNPTTLSFSAGSGFQPALSEATINYWVVDYF